MRIFDRIASGHDVDIKPGERSPIELQVMIRRAAHEYTRVIGDEAAQFQAQADNDWTPSKGDYGILRPAFNEMWIEYTMPNWIVVDGESVRSVPSPPHIAVLLQQDSDVSFHAMGLISFGDRGAITVLPIDVSIANFDDISRMSEESCFLHSEDKLLGKLGQKALMPSMLTLLGPAYLTLGWLNCKGVRTELSGPPSAIRKKRAKKGQHLGLDYRRIVLDGRLRAGLDQNRNSIARGERLHIVRGHIRTYTAERPAFGSYVGNMWIHQHMRGDADLGRINHEYHVTNRGAQ